MVLVKNCSISTMYSIILVILCCVLSSSVGFYTTSTKVRVAEEETAIRKTMAFPAPKTNVNITATTGEGERGVLLIRMERNPKPKKAKMYKDPTTPATIDDDELPSMMDDYANLGLDDEKARKIEADYMWSVVGKTPSTNEEMNSFVDDYVQQAYHTDLVTNKTVGDQKKRILNVIITDMTDNKKILISNKNYTW